MSRELTYDLRVESNQVENFSVMPQHMLIVEADSVAAQLYTQWFQDMGFQTTSAADGGKAMQVLGSQSIDGLILDLQAPVMDGLAMLTQLRQRYADIPVIVLATVDMTDLLLEALESGAQDYLTKPVSQHLFKQKCRRVFLQHRRGELSEQTVKPTEDIMKRILIVDDDADIRMLLRSILESYGYYCDEAQNGLEAIQKVEAQSYNLMLLDYSMPLMNGLEVIQKITQRSCDLRPGVIMVTAQADETLRKQALKAGAAEVLTKPFDLDHVLLTIGRTLQNKHSSSRCSQ
jgi:CheY-like chemotaxis protein